MITWLIAIGFLALLVWTAVPHKRNG